MDNSKVIEKIIGICENHDFDYLDSYYDDEKNYILRIEYVGNKIEYKTEDKFDKIDEYKKFSCEQGDIVCNEFMKIYNELHIMPYNIGVWSWEWCSFDYPVIELEFEGEKV